LNNISQEADALFAKISSDCLQVRNKLPDFNSQDEDNKNRIAIAKGNLIVSFQLAGQMKKNLNKGYLLISLIGLRSLIENYINTKYAFDHPSHKEDFDWTCAVCKDYFVRGNNPEAWKSGLDNLPIKKRAKEAGLEEIYTENFVSLCDYTHMLINPGLLNDPVYFKKFTQAAYICTLTTLHDIKEIIREHFNISIPNINTYEKELISFRDQI